MPLIRFATAPTTLRFHDTVLEEHVDEAAFLYEQRRLLLDEPDEPWDRVAAVEQRLEAHIDALVLGRGRALELCVARAATANPSVLFVATCVLCRHHDSSSLARLFEVVGSDDSSSLAAIRDALRVECPAIWVPFIERALTGRDAAWVAMLADVGSHRQLPISAALTKALGRGLGRGSVACALGRLHAEDARSALWRCLEDDQEEGKAAALVALLRLGDSDALDRGLDVARQEAWARWAIGCAGAGLAVQTMLRTAHGDAVEGQSIEALGVLGDPSAIPGLLALLSREDVARQAARAMHWITGAALFKQSFVPDPVDEGTMTAVELDAWKNKQELPRRSDGGLFGQTVRKLSQDPDEWKRWLADHQGQFRPGSRHRAGRLCTPKVILDCLAHPDSDANLRRLAALEIDIRYGCRIPFDVTLPVAMQRRAIGQMFVWAEAQGDRFAPGQWFFAGRPVDA